jgi:hypothetical protein
VRDVNVVKKGVKLLIFPTPIRLDGNDLEIKLSFNQMLKFKKVFEHLRLCTKEINSSKLAIIIDEANIIFFCDQRSQWKDPKHLRK